MTAARRKIVTTQDAFKEWQRRHAEHFVDTQGDPFTVRPTLWVDGQRLVDLDGDATVGMTLNTTTARALAAALLRCADEADAVLVALPGGMTGEKGDQ